MPVAPPDGPDPERLRQLEARIAEKKQALGPGPRADEHFSQANIAWRMVIELVSGLGIGFGIGYGLDVLMGTLPLMLVIFTLLGFAAGVRVMLRTAREVEQERQAAEAARKEG
jgi:ATP synthase protein I